MSLLVTVTAKENASDETKEIVLTQGPQFMKEGDLFSGVRYRWFGTLPEDEIYFENVPGQVEPDLAYQFPSGRYLTS